MRLLAVSDGSPHVVIDAALRRTGLYGSGRWRQILLRAGLKVRDISRGQAIS